MRKGYGKHAEGEHLSEDGIGSGRVGASEEHRARGLIWREIAAHR